MKHLSLRRARTARSLLAVAAVALAVPAGASADIPITSFKAGPVAAYSHQSGLPLTSGALGNSQDTGCAYGTSFSLPPAPQTQPFINTTAPDTPLQLSTQAGATTDFCVAFRLNPGHPATGEDINNSVVQLPVGTLAEIDRAAKCSVSTFNRESPARALCPTNTQVGTAQAQLDIYNPALPAPGIVTRDSPGRIYALDTPSTDAALLGVALLSDAATGAETKFLIHVTQQGSPTVGLINKTDELSKQVLAAAPSTFAPIAIKANALRFWGAADAHKHVDSTFAPASFGQPAANFFRVGTTCFTEQVTKLTVNPYTDTATTANSKPTEASSTPYKLTGCENLPFNPTFNAQLTGELEPGGHPGLSIQIKSPEGDQDLGATKITLPLGVATDLTRIQNACPQATFEADQCGDATIIGSVKATLSGINEDVVSGNVHMVRVEGKTLPALGFDFNGRLPLRIAGVTDIDPQGRIVNTFSNLPSIPQRSLDVTLLGGAKGILQLPNTTKCQTSAFDATLTSQNGWNKSFALPKTCGAQFTASLKKADSRRPTLYLSGAGATGKKISSIRWTLPSGVTINRNKIRSLSKIDKLEDGVSGRTTRSRLSKKTARFSIPKPGSNGLRIMTRTGALGASKKFTERDNALTLALRIVYTDGSKANVSVPLQRK